MRSLYIFFFLFVANSVFGQHVFQRTYPIDDRQHLHAGMAVASDGGFFLLSYYSDIADQVLRFHVTRHHYKGDVLWAYDYTVEDQAQFVTLDAAIYQTEDKGVIFAFSELNPVTTGLQEGVMVKIDEDGNFEWSQTIGLEDDAAFTSAGIPGLVDNFDEGVVYANLSSNNDAPQSNAYLASISQDGMMNWSNLYTALDEEGAEESSFMTAIDDCPIDTTFMIAGVTSVDTSNYSFLAKVDRNGDLLWSKKYLQEFGNGLQNQVTDVACGLDTSTVITGLLVEEGTGSFLSYVSKYDVNGDTLWSNVVELPGALPLALTSKVISDANNNVIVSGKLIDLVSGDQSDYIIRMNSLGDLIWSKTFPRINTYFLDQNIGFLLGGDLEQNGNEYMLSGLEIDLSLGSLYPFVVRFDDEGSAVCEDNAMAMLNDTLLTFQVDTLVWQSENLFSAEDAVVQDSVFLEYDLPMVTLQDTFFCPQDPVMVTLDATADFAISYEWDSGDTTATLEVTEDGEYIVTVTFDTLTCFTLCDTAIITLLEFPSLAMNVSNNDFCDTGAFIVSSGASSGLPPYTYDWSTGEAVPNISVTEFGNYVVTITDQCGNSESSQINVSEGNLPNPDIPNLDFNQQFFCETGQYQVNILNGGAFTDIVWSTGESGESIIVPGPGTYTVTATNCFQEVTATINDGDFAELDPFSVSSSINSDTYCEDQTFLLMAMPTGGLGPYTFMWSTGDTGPSINVSDVGTYAVTVSDNCMDMEVVSLDVTADAIPSPIAPVLSTNFDEYCTTGTIPIVLTNANEFTEIVWGTGQINVAEVLTDAPGTFTVMAVNCFQDVSADVTIVEGDIPEPTQPILSVNVDSFCNTGAIIISIENANSGFFGVEWSTGEVNVSQIEVDEPGTYDVTATNCFQEVSASEDVAIEDFPEGLKFPNIFSPTDLESNRSFGPFVECPEIIDDYELQVFNRWGKMVFQTDEVGQRWNGAVDTKPQPSEVFYWYARYNTPAGETILEGDVTLVR